jgi:uncharacterized protein (UPF0147 family)
MDSTTSEVQVKINDVLSSFAEQKITHEECMNQIQEIINYDYFNKDTQIALIWSIEDVQSEEVRPDLDDAEAMNVLDKVSRDHDCNYGVSWETLDITAEELYPKNDINSKENDDD